MPGGKLTGSVVGMLLSGGGGGGELLKIHSRHPLIAGGRDMVGIPIAG